MTMLLNYSHPLSEEMLETLTTLLGERPDVLSIDVDTDRQRPLSDVAYELADATPLGADQWQTTQMVINPPGLAPLAIALIVEIHGRCGYFPPLVNIRPVQGAVPPRFEVGEIVNLQMVRDAARQRRF